MPRRYRTLSLVATCALVVMLLIPSLAGISTGLIDLVRCDESFRDGCLDVRRRQQYSRQHDAFSAHGGADGKVGCRCLAFAAA